MQLSENSFSIFNCSSFTDSKRTFFSSFENKSSSLIGNNGMPSSKLIVSFFNLIEKSFVALINRARRRIYPLIASFFFSHPIRFLLLKVHITNFLHWDTIINYFTLFLENKQFTLHFLKFINKKKNTCWFKGPSHKSQQHSISTIVTKENCPLAKALFVRERRSITSDDVKAKNLSSVQRLFLGPRSGHKELDDVETHKHLTTRKRPNYNKDAPLFKFNLDIWSSLWLFSKWNKSYWQWRS